MLLETYALSIAGRRTNYEGAICARPELGLFVVADGVGGYEGGEIASGLAVEAIHSLVRRTTGDGDVTWPYAIDPQRSVTENDVMVATRLGERPRARRVGARAADRGAVTYLAHVRLVVTRAPRGRCEAGANRYPIALQRTGNVRAPDIDIVVDRDRRGLIEPAYEQAAEYGRRG
jgi:hypothetical protein